MLLHDAIMNMHLKWTKTSSHMDQTNFCCWGWLRLLGWVSNSSPSQDFADTACISSPKCPKQVLFFSESPLSSFFWATKHLIPAEADQSLPNADEKILALVRLSSSSSVIVKRILPAVYFLCFISGVMILQRLLKDHVARLQ